MILRPSAANYRRLSAALARGELVGVPSETVYGLAAHALDATACARIFELKGRPRTDPLIVHVADLDGAGAVGQLPPAAQDLGRRFWPGPLTLVVRRHPHVPDIVTAGRATIAVRVPSHPAFRRLLRTCGLPLAAPSANPFGYVSPTTAAHVAAGFGRRLRWILDGGPCRHGIESTIIDLTHPARPRLLRPGALPQAAVEAALGRPLATSRPRPGARAGQGDRAPGQSIRHYSPRTEIRLASARRLAQLATAPQPGEAYVFLRRPAGSWAATVVWLTTRGGAALAARRLFATLRALDEAGLDRAWIEWPEGEDGLVPALQDRLRRAAAGRPVEV